MGTKISKSDSVVGHSHAEINHRAGLVSFDIEKTTKTSIANLEKHQRQNSGKAVKSDLLDIDHSSLVVVDAHSIKNLRSIGRGNFGLVFRATLRDSIDVALKTFDSSKHSFEQDDETNVERDQINMKQLFDEARLMATLNHENLLRIHGVTFIGRSARLTLITEFMVHGSLLDYLVEQRTKTRQVDSTRFQSTLNYFGQQIFQGMIYLESRSIVHRDLAARNCLIGERNLLKIGDFGLTRLTDCGLYKGTYRSIFALRWTAPEAVLHSKFTSKSDVWSFVRPPTGITLWELYTLGQRPFTDLPNPVVKIILKDPSESLSRYLTKPELCHPEEIYTHVILSCLTYNDKVRPRFKDLADKVSKMFQLNKIHSVR